MPSGVLEVRRDSQATGLFGRVEVAWEAAYTDGGTHPVPVDAILVNSRGQLVFAAGQTVPENELILQLNPNSVCELHDYDTIHGACISLLSNIIIIARLASLKVNVYQSACMISRECISYIVKILLLKFNTAIILCRYQLEVTNLQSDSPQ